MSAAPRLGPHREHTHKDPCPICAGVRCLSFDDGGTICRRQPSDHPLASGWYHETDPAGDGGHDLRAVDPDPGSERLPDDELDPIHRRLIAAFPLDDGGAFDGEHVGFRRPTPHRDELIRRGMTDAQIAERGIFSYPARGRPAIAAALVAEFGEGIVGGVPGLYLGRQGNVAARYPNLAGAAGVGIPITDEERRVVGVLIRRDAPTNGGGKYQPLSSNPSRGYAGGCASGSRLHVAHPLGPRPDPDPAPSWPLGVPGATEGPLKAIVASNVLGETVLGMPGLSGHRAVVAALKNLGATQVVVALDKDAKPETRARVEQAEDALAREATRAGIAPLLASWDTSCKGIDDALAAGAGVTVAPFPAERVRIRSGDVVETDPPPARPRPLRSVDEARSVLARRVREALERPASDAPRFVQVSAGTGVGKTRAVADVLNAWRRDGWPHKTVMKRGLPIAEPVRVLILAPTKELCAEVYALLSPGLAMLQEGRDPDATHDWGCLEPERIALAGAGRHNPHADVCSTCAEANGWEPRHPECNYLRSKALAEDARVIVAPDTSYFNGSSELRKFDIVIGDEVLFPYLIEDIVVDRARVAAWRERMNQLDAEHPTIIDHRGEETVDARYPLDSPFRHLVDAFGMVQPRCPSGRGRWSRALPALREVCPDLGGVVAAIRAVDPNDASGRYPCETPELWTADPKGALVPLRALRDLADAIAAELERDERADTRFWLTPDGMLFLRPRQHAIDILHRKTVVNLDATPHPALRFLLPDPEVITVDAPVRQHVTQTTDILGTAKELAGVGNTNLGRLQAAIEQVTAAAEHPVVFSRKAFAPGGADEGAPTFGVGNERADFGWFDNQTRGLNRYEHADVLVAVGRYSHPIDRLRAEVMAARFSPDPAPEGERLDLLCYDWRDAEGKGRGRWTRADADPDVNAAVRWSEGSSILQAIGRGRGVNHKADDPLRVYVLSNLPIDGLAVDRLTTLEQLGADPPRRKTPPGFYAERDERNAETEATNRERVVGAICALQDAGHAITWSAVARHAGVSRVTLHQNATLKALVQQAQSGSNAAGCVHVNPSSDNDSSTSAQGFTCTHLPDSRIPDQDRTGSHPPSEPMNTPPPRPDIAPVRAALGAADHARERAALHRANEALAERLAPLRRPGRDPVPKNRGDISRTVQPEAS